MIAVVDAGLGNLRSVVRALERAGAEDVRLVDAPRGIHDAARVVVPGQGAFGEAAALLRPDGALGKAVIDSINAGKPYLGICLGLQILFQSSEESPGHPGLGLLGGRVVRLPSDQVDETGRRLKVPHIGWSRVAVRGFHPVLELPSGDAWFYFVHSYHAIPTDDKLISALCAFGQQPLTAAVARDNILAVQFHPEKSQQAGLDLLRAFLGVEVMRVLPAIDLLGGDVVRLKRGRREEASVYSREPAAVARGFIDAGATRLHVIDLDAAFGEPSPANQRALDDILALGVEVQHGGGLRTPAQVDAVFGRGVAAAVLGTLAVSRPEELGLLCARHPGRIVVAVDAEDGQVRVAGWTEASALTPLALAHVAAQAGAVAVLYTDISRDGMQVGPAVAATAALQAELPIRVIASGGIGSLADLSALAAAGISEVVVGRALYEGAFDFAAAQQAAGDRDG